MKVSRSENPSGTPHASSKSTAGLVVHAALLDFDSCANDTNSYAMLAPIKEGLDQIKQLCTTGEHGASKGQDDTGQTEDHCRLVPLFRSLRNLYSFIYQGFSSNFDQAIKAASDIENCQYKELMINFFSSLQQEFAELRKDLSSVNARQLLTFQMSLIRVYSAWQEVLNEAGVESSMLAYKKLARSLNRYVSVERDLDALFSHLYEVIKYFLRLFQKLTLGLIICRLFSQGYDPVQHPLIFISTSARINKGQDDKGNQQNGNGTVRTLMQTLPTLVKDFLRIHCNVSQDDQKTIEFWRNMPLDKSDNDNVQIHSGYGELYDQSKMGIILWATHLLSRHFKQAAWGGEGKAAATAHVSIKASCFDDLLIRKPIFRLQGEAVQYAMHYLERNSHLLPEGVELSLIGFMPLLSFWKKTMLQSFGAGPIVGTGPTVSRHSINSIVNSLFDVLPEHRSMDVKCWLCCCAYASPIVTSFWLQNLKNYERNLSENSSHVRIDAAPVEVAMDRNSNLTTPLLPRNNLYEEMKDGACRQCECGLAVCACVGCNFYVASPSKQGCC